jgi:uncharacterized protein (TIGR02996 family)
MSARDALTAAIVAAPDDDLPRQVFADYLEDAGDEAYARFIRGQIERAKTPAWEPFAVRWDRGLIPGADPNLYRDRLPAVVDNWNVEWDLTEPFRRGFGTAVRIRDLYTFLDTAPQLFDAAPVTELTLPTAPLDAWRRFAVQPWLPRVKSVRFAGLSMPIEPIRCLCESPLATGLEEIYFDRANSPAMPELMAGMAASQLSEQLVGLHFRMGDSSVQDMILAFGGGPWPKLERLSLVSMGISEVLLVELRDTGWFGGVTELNLSDNPLDNSTFYTMSMSELAGQVSILVTRRLTYGVEYRTPTDWHPFSHVRRLDMSETIGLDHIELAALEQWFPNVVSLGLAHTNPGNGSLVRLLDSPLWPDLVEVDLSQNSFLPEGLDRLLAIARPERLAWIGLPDCHLHPRYGDALRRKFADVITDAESSRSQG